jgi:hypothetical protein
MVTSSPVILVASVTGATIFFHQLLSAWKVATLKITRFMGLPESPEQPEPLHLVSSPGAAISIDYGLIVCALELIPSNQAALCSRFPQ